jgi:O-acetyl-ADP-ribose deacetylase (regulator of RNase III)
MIHYTIGNLLDSKAQALVNTVNTVGVMGKGIALQFKEAYPHNYTVYRKACKEESFTTGQILTVQDVDVTGVRFIVNFPTKQHWRAPSKYEYIESGLVALRDWLQKEAMAGWNGEK